MYHVTTSEFADNGKSVGWNVSSEHGSERRRSLSQNAVASDCFRRVFICHSPVSKHPACPEAGTPMHPTQEFFLVVTSEPRFYATVRNFQKPMH